MDLSVNQTTKQIADLDAQITAENLRMAAHSQAKHEETQARLESARTALSTAEAALLDIQTQVRDQHASNESFKTAGMAAERELAAVKGQIDDCQGMIGRSMDAQKNSLIPYGKGIREVLERIKAMRWSGDSPLGPLGMFVKAKDPKTWGELLRNQLGGYLTAFAVTDARDRVELKKLLERSGKCVVKLPKLSL